MEIGQRIKTRREELNLTQEELAKMTGYKSRSSINKIELDGRGLPQSKILAFANALKTTPAYLLGWESEEKLESVLNDNSAYIAMAPAINFLRGIGYKLSYAITKNKDGSQIIHDIKIIDGETIHLVTFEGLQKFISGVTPFVKFSYAELIQQKCPNNYKYVFKPPVGGIGTQEANKAQPNTYKLVARGGTIEIDEKTAKKIAKAAWEAPNESNNKDLF